MIAFSKAYFALWCLAASHSMAFIAGLFFAVGMTLVIAGVS